MGVFIHLNISHAVTADEWKKAYDDSLKIITKLNLADLREMTIHDTKVDCLTRSSERKVSKTGFKGWIGDGDYRYLTCSETNSLRSQLNEYDPLGRDPLLAYMEDYRHRDPKNSCYEFWCGKTQGEPQHITLLTVGVMMQSRLKNKAFVHGDITRGQCQLAVELANEILDDKIELPEQCVLERLYKRVSCLPIEDRQKIRMIEKVFLGEKNSDYGEFMRLHFAKDDLNQYWQEQFVQYWPGIQGYQSLYKDYLIQGYDFRDLCRMTRLKNRDGDDCTDRFIQTIIDSEIYIKEKDCEDMLELNTDGGASYGIGALLAQFAFGRARNKRADRYIPLDEVRTILREEMGDHADTDGLIDQYLADQKQSAKQADTDVLHDYLKEIRDKIHEERENYDITRAKELLFYEHGLTMVPALKRSMIRLGEFNLQLLKEEFVQETLAATFSDKCQLLAERSFELCIRDQDWEKIFADIEKNPESFKRYVTAAYIDLKDMNILRAVQAFIINDDLYEDIMNDNLLTDKETAVS